MALLNKEMRYRIVSCGGKKTTLSYIDTTERLAAELPGRQAPLNLQSNSKQAVKPETPACRYHYYFKNEK